MMNAYDKSYLSDFRNNLGFAFDCAANHCGIKLCDFHNFFIVSNIASQIEKGNSKYLCGMSGTELVCSVFERIGLSVDIPSYPAFDRTAEYWTGWILAYYQWKSALSFKSINHFVPIETLCNMYNPFHEASEEKFAEAMNQIIEKKKQPTKLQFFRKKAGLTQKELAELSGINLRTLQQYEIRGKDINKAAGEVINRLAYVLNCNFYDIMELS